MTKILALTASAAGTLVTALATVPLKHWFPRQPSGSDQRLRLTSPYTIKDYFKLLP